MSFHLTTFSLPSPVTAQDWGNPPGLTQRAQPGEIPQCRAQLNLQTHGARMLPRLGGRKLRLGGWGPWGWGGTVIGGKLRQTFSGEIKTDLVDW